MIGADLCNKAIAAVGSGLSFEQSGLPQTDEGRAFWERLSTEIAAMVAAGIDVSMADEFDDSTLPDETPDDTPDEPVNLERDEAAAHEKAWDTRGRTTRPTKRWPAATNTKPTKTWQSDTRATKTWKSGVASTKARYEAFRQAGLADSDDPEENNDAFEAYEKMHGPMLVDKTTLTYREKLAMLLERDEDEAHRKEWDTRGRGRGKHESPRVVARVEMKPATAHDLARLKALGIVLPPAWKDVHVAVDPDAALVATGVDAKGRTQPRYSAAHTARVDAAKFNRVKEFDKELPKFRAAIERDLKRGSDPSDHEAASVLYVIDKTAFRPGSTKNTKADKKAYGATTLEAKHVKVDGNKVTFKFVGKKGVAIQKTVEDAKLASMMTKRSKSGGRLFDVSDGALLDYVKKNAGEDFMVKDLRTWHGTALALKTIKGMPKPKTDAAFKKAQREVAKIVSTYLGNTPAVAIKSYINPAAWHSWQTKKTS